MLKLVQFHPAFGVRNMSPFCLKLETYLRMTGIAHEVVWSSDTRSAPKGKLPYIIDGAVVMGDSALIIEYLKGKYGDPLDGKLRAEKRAHVLAYGRLLEDSLMFPLLYARWIDAAGWSKMKTLFKRMPFLLRLVVPGMVRNGVRKQIHAQGTGRHTRDEIYRFGLTYLTAIETLLGDNDFMLGNAPTSLDATAYGFLDNLVETDFDNPLNRQARATPSFVAYCARIRQRWFDDVG
jgi:glutathione S-transferase